MSSSNIEILSSEKIAQRIADLQGAYQSMTSEFNAFAQNHNGLECVQNLISGKFRVACQDFFGVKLTEAKAGAVVATYKPHWFQNNSFGTVQGGSLAVPLDGIITLSGRTLVEAGNTAVTKGLSVTYVKPVIASNPDQHDEKLLKVFGHAERTNGKNIVCHGWLENDQGEVVATARAEIIEMAMHR